MSKSNLYLTIMNGIWLIEPSAINDFGPVVKSLLEKGVEFNASEKKEHNIMVVAADSAVSFSKYNGGFNNAPAGSTAVVKISGAIMKEDNCGDLGTESIGNIIKSADKHPNISSIVLVIDSPGGTVAGTEALSNVIKASETPVVALVDGMMASAAYWIGSSAKEIYASNKTDMIGSIGTMMSFADAQPMWEKQGVKFHEIYADASKDKNKDFMEARKGNYDKVKEKLNAINDVFLASVKENRGDKLNTKTTLSGKVFMPDEAIAEGLIDGYSTFDAVVARAQELSQSNNSTNNNQNPQNTMKIKATWLAMTAFLTSAFEGFKADETIVTDEHLEKMNAELETLAKTKADLATAVADLATAKTELKTAQDSVAALTTEKETLTAEVARLGKLNPGAQTAIKKETDSVESKDDVNAEIDAMEHNQTADSNPLFNGSAKKQN